MNQEIPIYRAGKSALLYMVGANVSCACFTPGSCCREFSRHCISGQGFSLRCVAAIQFLLGLVLHFGNPDPYAKCELSHRDLPEECFFDEDGNIHVKNLSAYWIPEFTMTQEIAGAVYKVSGSYEGTELFTKKIERMLAEKLSKKLEDDQ